MAALRRARERSRIGPRDRCQWAPAVLVFPSAVLLLLKSALVLLPQASPPLPPPVLIQASPTHVPPSALTPLVVDLGVDNGQDSLVYLRKGFRVVAVEANPLHLFRSPKRLGDCSRDTLLESSAKTSSADLLLLNAAISNVSGAFVMLCDAGVSSYVITASHSNCTGRRHVPVPTISCRDLIMRHGRPALVKVDLEGMEDICIRSILTLPQGLLPEAIAFESPVRAPTPRRQCSSDCIAHFLRIVSAMEAKGYAHWKRQWWRAQGQPGVMPYEVRDKGHADTGVWVNSSEVLRDGCGHFKISEYSRLPVRAVGNLAQSTGCDFHARLTQDTIIERPSGPSTLAARLLRNGTRRSPAWPDLCQSGAAMVLHGPHGGDSIRPKSKRSRGERA
uniref:Methyltransferase FkbM domain-containing protein n=1 Tax=Haptolina ericina TaxID=156174 RepID=A0A7S3F4J7_9EUKA|mmetsp:Transcript_50700/g.113938  ORF Transcript_50700/g.113938 Transcript_50700/m.113938 type:complete len:390 (+) Transcript_50700:57-1226(+)